MYIFTYIYINYIENSWSRGIDAMPPRLKDPELFDVYDSHVKDCTVCQVYFVSIYMFIYITETV